MPTNLKLERAGDIVQEAKDSNREPIRPKGLMTLSVELKKRDIFFLPACGCSPECQMELLVNVISVGSVSNAGVCHFSGTKKDILAPAVVRLSFGPSYIWDGTQKDYNTLKVLDDIKNIAVRIAEAAIEAGFDISWTEDPKKNIYLLGMKK